jgi:dipeptidase D
MDMVCEKDKDLSKDMEKEGLDIYVEDGFVKAKGTTLGGDDGIAVACGLAILADDSLMHPPLEVVITVDEEIGMVGAQAFDCSLLKGRLMLNADSENEKSK